MTTDEVWNGLLTQLVDRGWALLFRSSIPQMYANGDAVEPGPHRFMTPLNGAEILLAEDAANRGFGINWGDPYAEYVRIFDPTRFEIPPEGGRARVKTTILVDEN